MQAEMKLDAAEEEVRIYIEPKKKQLQEEVCTPACCALVSRECVSWLWTPSV